MRAKSIQGDGGGDDCIVNNVDWRFSQKNTSKPVGVCRRCSRAMEQGEHRLEALWQENPARKNKNPAWRGLSDTTF
jgi:hypothetical protein